MGPAPSETGGGGGICDLVVGGVEPRHEGFNPTGCGMAAAAAAAAAAANEPPRAC